MAHTCIKQEPEDIHVGSEKWQGAQVRGHEPQPKTENTASCVKHVDGTSFHFSMKLDAKEGSGTNGVDEGPRLLEHVGEGDSLPVCHRATLSDPAVELENNITFIKTEPGCDNHMDVSVPRVAMVTATVIKEEKMEEGSGCVYFPRPKPVPVTLYQVAKEDNSRNTGRSGSVSRTQYHSILHKETTDTSCGKNTMKASETKTLSGRYFKNEQRHVCPVCDKAHVVKMIYTNDLPVEQDERPPLCSRCRERKKRPCIFCKAEEPEDVDIEDKELYLCEDCSKITNGKKFMCPECGHFFMGKNSMGRHRRSCCRGYSISASEIAEKKRKLQVHSGIDNPQLASPGGGQQAVLQH